MRDEIRRLPIFVGPESVVSSGRWSAQICILYRRHVEYSVDIVSRNMDRTSQLFRSRNPQFSTSQLTGTWCWCPSSINSATGWSNAT
jgi:hypothetical protein